MKVSIFRKISIAIVSLVASSTVFAAMDMDSRVTQLEHQMQQMRTATVMGTNGTKTATDQPKAGSSGFCVSFDVLYWYAKAGGTELAYTDTDTLGQLPIKGRTEDIDFSWDWGIKVGLGYDFDCDGWGIKAQYTWFDSKSKNDTKAKDNVSIIPLRGSSTIVASSDSSLNDRFIYCTNAKSQYDFNYNAIDLELGRVYYVRGMHSFRSHLGLKTISLKQEQFTRYTGGDINESTPNTLGLQGNTVQITDGCKFWGLGPRLGVESTWGLGGGFSLFGNVSSALLLGHFIVDHKERYSRFDENRIDLRANQVAFSPIAQMRIGLCYDHCFENSMQHIGVGLGFEAQYLWRQNQILHINDTDILKYERHSEDVSMQGVTLDIQWGF